MSARNCRSRLDSFPLLELAHVLRRGHAGNDVIVLTRSGRGLDFLASRSQPLLHQGDVGLELAPELFCEIPHSVLLGALGREPGHLQRLIVVSDHLLHEPHVRHRIANAGEIGRLIRRDHLGLRSRRSRPHDRWLALRGVKHRCRQECGEQQTMR